MNVKPTELVGNSQQRLRRLGRYARQVTEQQWRDALLELDRSRWGEYLDQNSGLPGPRANLTLAAVVAELADADLAEQLLASTDEYRAMCGAIALAMRATDSLTQSRIRELARDTRWRVREAVAIGLQRLGDEDLGPVTAIVEEWSTADDFLVQRAAVATLCEPRLLRSPQAAAAAIDACNAATASVGAAPAAARKDPAFRVLRQALGYCWSVAVAADPEPGLRAFRSLDESDPDIAWIVASNLTKKRLSRLL